MTLHGHSSGLGSEVRLCVSLELLTYSNLTLWLCNNQDAFIVWILVFKKRLFDKNRGRRDNRWRSSTKTVLPHLCRITSHTVQINEEKAVHVDQIWFHQYFSHSQIQIELHIMQLNVPNKPNLDIFLLWDEVM